MSTLKELKALGGFVSATPIKKEIKFKTSGDDDYTATIHVKQLSVGDYEAIFLSGTDERSRTAKLISEAVTLGPEGKEKIAFQDAYRLHPGLASAMVDAFNEVNSPKKR